jgi:hypothetical protein
MKINNSLQIVYQYGSAALKGALCGAGIGLFINSLLLESVKNNYSPSKNAIPREIWFKKQYRSMKAHKATQGWLEFTCVTAVIGMLFALAWKGLTHSK